MSTKPWWVLRVQVSQELTAEKQVRELGYDAMAPYEEGLRRVRGNNRKWKWPLYPGYLFASWPNWREGWHRIRGVDPATGEIDPAKAIGAIYSYLHPMWVPMPYLLPPSDVEHLQSIADGKYKPEEHDAPRLKVGDQVLVSSGPFEGRTGTLTKARGKSGKRATVTFKDEKNLVDVEFEVVKLEKV